MKIPNGHQRVMPYLIIPDAEKFLAFAKTVFNADEKDVHRHNDGSIMHAEITIGDSALMFGQSNETWQPITAGLYIYVENADLTYQKALEHGAVTVMEPETKDYGRTCGVKDPSGNTWWITSI